MCLDSVNIKSFRDHNSISKMQTKLHSFFGAFAIIQDLHIFKKCSEDKSLTQMMNFIFLLYFAFMLSPKNIWANDEFQGLLITLILLCHTFRLITLLSFTSLGNSM